MKKNYSLLKIVLRALSLTFMVQLGPLRAESDDVEKFERINRDVLFHRSASEIGNHHSLRHPDMKIHSSPRVSGSGCLKEQTTVVLSEDKRVLSVLFDNYDLQLGGALGILKLEKSCQIQIPLNIPFGHRVSIVALDFRGFVALPIGGAASLMAKHRFYRQFDHNPLSRRFVRHSQFHGFIEEEYILTSGLKHKLQWSGCGGLNILQIQTELKARTNSDLEEAMATLDSLDGQLSEDLSYHLLWEKCQPI